MHYGDPLIGHGVLVNSVYIDHRCLEQDTSSYLTAAAALLAPAALPSVLADVAATAILALPALPPVHADAAPAALLAPAALPPLLAEAGAAALLAPVASPPVHARHKCRNRKWTSPRLQLPECEVWGSQSSERLRNANIGYR